MRALVYLYANASLYFSVGPAAKTQFLPVCNKSGKTILLRCFQSVVVFFFLSWRTPLRLQIELLLLGEVLILCALWEKKKRKDKQTLLKIIVLEHV